MNWESIEQVVSYFQLDVDDNEPAKVKKAIIMKMAEIHPDKNKQQFKSENDRELWQYLNSAKMFLDNFDEANAALIPVSQLPAIIRSIQKATLQPIENRVSDLRQEARSDFHSRNLLPRIGSGAFAAICGFLFTFSSSLKDHPILGDFISLKGTQIALLVAMFYSGLFFVMTWMRERRQEAKLDWLVTNEGTRATIRFLLEDRSLKRHGNRRRFTLRDLTRALSMRGSEGYRGAEVIRRLIDEFPFLGGSTLRGSIAEKVAKLQIESLRERGILFELPKKGFEVVYELSDEAAKELIEDIKA